MLCNNINKGIYYTRLVNFSLSAINKAIQKDRSFYEADARSSSDADPLPSHVRDALQQKLTEPFTEIKEGSWFSSLALSLQLKEPDVPKRFAWNMESLSYDNLVRSLRRNKREYNIFQQRYLPQRHGQLGNEVAAAHFIVFRFGAVKFYGVDKWIKRSKKGDPENYDKELPKTFDPKVYVECIDTENVELYYEGLDNLQKLSHLRWLSFRNSPYCDDWFIDKITNEYSHSLEYLDISGCKLVTHRGLAAICKLTNLTTLVVENLADSFEFEVSCIMLQEAMPNLNIVGITYTNISGKSISSVNEKIETVSKI